ncbi:MAG: DUF3489 domain-containing protein [Rhizomicrobium sp.]
MTKTKKCIAATPSRTRQRASKTLKGKTKFPAAENRAARADSKTSASSVAPTKGKLATIISMLRKAPGASIAALCDATEWQAHSVRGAISGTLKKKLGLKVESVKRNGVRFYRIAG